MSGRRPSSASPPSLTPKPKISSPLTSPPFAAKAGSSAEVTVGSTIIRARLIDQSLHSVVDPTSPAPGSGGPGPRDASAAAAAATTPPPLGAVGAAGPAPRPQPANANADEWFRDNKRRIMWVLNANDSSYNILLTHSLLSGKKALSVNGVKVAAKGKALMDFGGRFKFRVGKVDMSVVVESKLTGKFLYSLRMEGLKEPVLTCT